MSQQQDLGAEQGAALRRLLVDTVTRRAPVQMSRRRTAFAAVALLAVGVLTGGTLSAAALVTTQTLPPEETPPPNPGPVFKLSQVVAFDRPATEQDALPVNLPSYALENAIPEQSRLIGAYEGRQVFLSPGISPAALCVFVWRPDNENDWVSACGGGVPLQIEQIGGLTVNVDSVDATRPTSWIAIDPNVSIVP